MLNLDFLNLDLLSVGIAIAGIGILGFVVFSNNKKSISNLAFFGFALTSIFWGIVNYLNYHVTSPDRALLLLRLVIASAVWHAFLFFTLAFVFPEDKIFFPKWYTRILLPLVILSSIVNLTPLSFSKITQFKEGGVAVVEKGPGLLLFISLVIFLISGGIYLLIKKTRKSQGVEKAQLQFISLGAFFTLSLIFVFNFFFPAVFDYVRFIPLGAVFLLPFIGFTTYAILKHHLFHAKVVAAEFLVFALAIATLFEAIVSQDILTLILHSSVFVLVLCFGILLIQGVLREVEQREELERLSEDLQNANDKLEDLNKFKTQLLSLASHQVKSPIAAIKGFATILSQGLYGPLEPKVKETVDKMYNSADGLLGLINSLLDIRKVEEGRMDYQFVKTDIVAMVKGVTGEIQPLADQKKLTLSFDGPKDSVYVNADSLKLKQVVQNLVDNAIKYTPSGFVKIALVVQGGSVTLSVSDSGLGISADLAPHLFEEFIRDERVKQKILGTGLGLFIAKKIVEAHGGTLAAKSDGEGKGSTFSVTLKTIV